MSTSTQSIAPEVFECMLDRAQAGMTEYFMPEAVRGVLIAGRDMLAAAGHIPGAPEPVGWTPGVPLLPDYPRALEVADFEKPSADGERMLRAKQFGHFWMVERSIRVSRGRYQTREIQGLVFAFGSVPIWTRDQKAAMRLAEHCDPIPAPPVAGYWLPLFGCSFHRPVGRSRARRQVKR
jgi:hypothetical protein